MAAFLDDNFSAGHVTREPLTVLRGHEHIADVISRGHDVRA